MIRRFHEAKQNGAAEVVIWGTGTPMREFLYVDDMAEACVHVMTLDKATYDANTQPMLSRIVFDSSKPDGTPRKLMNVGRVQALGWRATMGSEEGLARAYANFAGIASFAETKIRT